MAVRCMVVEVVEQPAMVLLLQVPDLVPVAL
jgi:hypothetical protein